MEFFNGCIKMILHLPVFTIKTMLMLPRKIINRFIILSFFALVGYCLATAIAVKSVIGIVLAIVSLAAAIVFLYILLQEQKPVESDEITS
jgi:hypothetical protein